MTGERRLASKDIPKQTDRNLSSWSAQRASLDVGVTEAEPSRAKHISEEALRHGEHDQQKEENGTLRVDASPLRSSLDARATSTDTRTWRDTEELRKRSAELEREMLQLREINAERAGAEMSFFEIVGVLLERVGRVPSSSAREAAASPQAARALFADIAAGFADALSKPVTVGAPALAEGDSLAMGPTLSLVQAALSRAVDGGDAVFEHWLEHDLDAGARARLEDAAGLLECCRRAANARPSCGSASEALKVTHHAAQSDFSFYRPDKKDPMDCLLAAKLLRLGASGPPATSLTRLGLGVYSIAGMRIQCRLDEQGQILVRRPSGQGIRSAADDSEVTPEMPSGPPAESEELELDTFFAQMASGTGLPAAAGVITLPGVAAPRAA